MRGSIFGYVVRAYSGEPLAGATIMGSEPGSLPAMDEGNGPRPAPCITAVTDSAGRFTFDDLREGNWTLWVQGSGGEPLGEATVHVFDNALSEVTIEVGGLRRPLRRFVAMRPTIAMSLNVPGSVRGRVIRADNGRPVADAAITVVSGAGPAPDIAPVTDGAGWFVFHGLPEGDWVLRALGPSGETGEATVRVAAGSVTEAIIRVAAPGG